MPAMADRTPDTGHRTDWTADTLDSGPAPAVSGVPVTAREAAAVAGVSERTIRRAIARGDLPAAKHAGAYRIAPAAVAAWVAAERTAPATADTGHRTAPDSTAPAAADAVAVATLRERVAGLERLSAELATERDAWRDQAARHEGAAQQLRTLVAQAQQLTRALPAGGDRAPPDQAPRPGPWARLRRRLRGE